MAGDRERCLDAGMDGYVGKPFDLEELFTVLESHLERSAVRLSSLGSTKRTVRGPARQRSGESRPAAPLQDVVDSAALQNGQWVPAHRDTVRAWRIAGAPHGISAWVDDAGRVVAANAGGYSATRTAFELAFKNAKVSADSTAIKSKRRRVK